MGGGWKVEQGQRTGGQGEGANHPWSEGGGGSIWEKGRVVWEGFGQNGDFIQGLLNRKRGELAKTWLGGGKKIENY